MLAVVTDMRREDKTCYLKPDTPLLQYYQFPDFLLKIPVSHTAKLLYMVLYDRARLSQRNNWIDEEGRVYLVFPITELAAKTGRSVSAVKAGLNELINENLLEKIRDGFGKPNRLFIRIPSDISPSYRQDSIPDTGGKWATKQMNRAITMRQNAYTGKRTAAFENYDYDGEDSF